MPRAEYKIAQPMVEPIDRRTFVEGQTNLQKLLSDQYRLAPWNEAHYLLEQTLIANTDNEILHKLGRVPRVCEIIEEEYIKCGAEVSLLTTAQVITSGGSGEIIVFNTEATDYGSNYSTTTGLFTCPVAGRYSINGSIYWVSGINGVRAQIALAKNADNFFKWGYYDDSTRSDPSFPPLAYTGDFAVGDTLGITAFHVAGADRSVSAAAGGTYASFQLVRDTGVVSKDETKVVLRTSYTHDVSLRIW